MYIYPSSPNSSILLQPEESAAIKIQSGFRGYRVRKQLLRKNYSPPNKRQLYKSSSNCRIEQQRRRTMDKQSNTVLSGNVNGELNTSEKTRPGHRNGSIGISIEDRSAIKIQAGVRGFLVRRKQKIASDAATKIQAGFRGFKARKEAQQLKQK